ncbi:hypothetical protein PG996_011282 [Apiospora saccharicola]|uniref:Uncharacterized protein n=1 Tax=Apiospora saccharicola TaxID=335842 RepID=A0ABR1UEN4_9PEZI
MKDTGRVEQLAGSNALVGALITQLQLRAFGLFGLATVVLWSLSPIVSQAALRIANVKLNAVDTTEQLTFINPLLPFHFGDLLNAPAFEEELVRFIFSSSLLSSSSLWGQTMDSCGNLRVPMVEALDGYQRQKWIGLPQNISDVVFSSLVGLPFSPRPSLKGRSSFKLNTSYISLDCAVYNLKRNGNCSEAFTKSPYRDDLRYQTDRLFYIQRRV